MFDIPCRAVCRLRRLAGWSVFGCLLAGLLLAGGLMQSAQAEAMTGLPVSTGPSGYPARGIELVIPFPPGGAQDVLARLLAERLTRQMDVPVTVTNRLGASGVLASETVARAPADGHVLLLQQASFAFQPGHEPRAPDPARDLIPVGRVAIAPLFLVIDARVPAQSVAEWQALLRSRPQTYSYGYGAAGSLAWLYTDRASRQADVPQLAAKGEAAVVQEMLAGRISACFCALPSVQAQVRSGKLRVLATTGDARSALLPAVPTFREAGYDGYETEQWLGLLAPPRTPQAIVQRLAGELRRALTSAEARERLAVAGLVPLADTPQAFAATLRDDASRWHRTARLSEIPSMTE
ncbi:MAG TPA: tripartite tricarboxylate transporter substrate binding protein [Pseudoxanthomonas sp.]|nr:tripartite tricarboxylate transporter substrate binding protein [Pseudoxanthomonas sp.]